jgi:hypothetical protein
MDRSALLKDADQILSKCGRPIAPAGLAYLDLDTSFLYQSFLAANSGIQSEPFVIRGETNFILRAISGFNSIVPPYTWPNYGYRIKFPDGSYYNGNWAASVGDWAFARGSYRMVVDGEVSCPPGSEIIVDLNPGAAAAAGNPQLLFEGVMRYKVPSALGKVAPKIPPRTFRNPNQNIMAAEWMLGTCELETPAGYEDQYFTFVSPVVTVPLTAGAATPQVSQQWPRPGGTRDFVWRETRFLFTATGEQAPPTGTPIIKITLPDGFSLTDNFVQCAEIAGPLPRDVVIPAGRSVLVDVSVVDGAGTGSITVQAYLKGARRRRS